MQNKEIQNNRPIIIFGLAILFLFLLSLIPGEIKVGPWYLKPIDLFMDIKPDSLLSQNLKLKQHTIPANTSMFSYITKLDNPDNKNCIKNLILYRKDYIIEKVFIARGCN